MRVLIIDDSPDTTWLLSHLLGCMAGFDVRCVEDASRAVAAAAGFRPDAICTDLSMPGIDGYSLALAIRKVPGLENVPIISVSGQVADTLRAQEAGIDAHFLKPVDFRAIGVALVEAVRSKSNSQSANGRMSVLPR